MPPRPAVEPVACLDPSVRPEPHQAEAIMDAIPRALDGEPLTREELARETARLAGDPGLAERLTSGFGDVFKPAAFEGEPCFAPSVGQTVRFTRPDRWLGSFQLPEPQAAMAQVV